MTRGRTFDGPDVVLRILPFSPRILTDTTIPRARSIVERLRASVPDRETVSSGIAEWDRSESGAELVARADRALYEAKRNGRDRAVSAAASSLQAG